MTSEFSSSSAAILVVTYLKNEYWKTNYSKPFNLTHIILVLHNLNLFNCSTVLDDLLFLT